MLRLAFASGQPPAELSAGREVGSWLSRAGRPFATLHRDATRRWFEWPGVGVFVVNAGAGTVDVWPDAGVDADAVHDAFARAVLPAALQTRPGWQTLHASAAVVDDGLIVFCGRSGAGKSTLSFAFGRAGFTHFADDAVAIELLPDVTAANLPFQPRLRESAADHFNASAPEPRPALPDRLPIHACLVLEQDGSKKRPEIVRVAPQEAFAALLAHAHCFDAKDADETRRLTADYLTIAERVPVFRVRYAPDLSAIDDLRRAILAAARPAPRSHPVSPFARRMRAARIILRLLPAFVAFGALKHLVPLTRLARWAWRAPARSPQTSHASEVISRVLQVGRWSGVPDRDCVQRSLLFYRELSRLGLDPTLVAGFRRHGDGLQGHAWIVVNDTIVGETGDALAAFTPAFEFGAGGRLKHAAAQEQTRQRPLDAPAG